MRFHFPSHKFARWELQWAILPIMVSTVALPPSAFRTCLLLNDLALILPALADCIVPKGFPLKRLSSSARTFFIINAAALTSIGVFFVPATWLWMPTKVKAGRRVTLAPCRIIESGCFPKRMNSPGRRVVIVTLVYPPDNYSGAARPYRFSKYLRELGYTVDVLAGTESRRPISDGSVHRFHAQFDHVPKDSFIEKVFRKTVLPHDEGITWIPELVSFAARWRDEAPVIFSTAPPVTTHLAGLALKKRFGWKWIADFRDPLADNPYRLPRVRKVDRWLQKTIFRNADALIANTDAVARLWRHSHPEAAAKIHQIWNGFDPEDGLGPIPIPRRERKVLRHVGSIYGDRYPEMLLSSVERLIAAGRCNPDTFCIDLVGPVGQPPETMPAAPWFHCVPGLVPKDEATRLIAETDYLLLLDVTRSNTGLQVPAKIFDYIRMGRPILACTVRDSPVDRILAQAGTPYVALYAGDPAHEIDRRVAHFLELPSTAVEPSGWFQDNFNSRLQTRALAAIIESVAGSGRTERAGVQ